MFNSASAQQIQVSDIFQVAKPVNSKNLTHILKLAYTQPPPNRTITGIVKKKQIAVNTWINDSITPWADAPLPIPDFTFYDINWTSGTRYQYILVGYDTVWVYPPNLPPYQTNVPWQSPPTIVVPCDITPTVDATADSRLDKRYSTVQHVDYPFNADPKPDGHNGIYLYRGGLYAGHNGDGSGTGRTYLTFDLIPRQTGENVCTGIGSISLYNTRLARSGSASIVGQRAASTVSLTSRSTLVWTNAPAPVGGATNPVTVNWSSQTPVMLWYAVPSASLVADAYGTSLVGGNSTFIVRKQDDEGTAGGWAYFASRLFTIDGQSGYGAHLLYALSDQPTFGSGGNGSGGGTGGGGIPPTE
jgi:hypothetical protein